MNQLIIFDNKQDFGERKIFCVNEKNQKKEDPILGRIKSPQPILERGSSYG